MSLPTRFWGYLSVELVVEATDEEEAHRAMIARLITELQSGEQAFVVSKVKEPDRVTASEVRYWQENPPGILK